MIVAGDEGYPAKALKETILPERPITPAWNDSAGSKRVFREKAPAYMDAQDALIDGLRAALHSAHEEREKWQALAEESQSEFDGERKLRIRIRDYFGSHERGKIIAANRNDDEIE